MAQGLQRSGTHFDTVIDLSRGMVSAPGIIHAGVPDARFWTCVRMAAGFVTLAAALGLSAYFVVFTATSEAVVSGRVVTLPTPIAGTVVALSGDTGDALEPGQAIATIHNERADSARLDALRTRQSGLAARLAAARVEVGLKTRERDRLRDAERQYGRRLADDLEFQRQEAQLRLGAAIADVAQRRREVTSASSLYDSSLVPRLELERRQTDLTIAERSLEAQRSVVGRAGLRLEALRHGSYIDSVPPAEKLRADDLEVGLSELALSIRELEQSLLQVGDAAQTEQVLVARMSDVVITSPARGRVWKRAVDAGQFVGAGSDVLELIESSSVRVEAYFHQRYLSRIKIGDPVLVRPLGSAQRLAGVVQWIGAEASASTRTVAPQWQPDQDKPMRVVVALDDADRSTVFVGQRARVTVSPRGSGPIPDSVLSLLAAW